MRLPPPHGQRSKSECAAWTSYFDRINSDGKASLKRKKSPEVTTDTHDARVSVIDFTRKIFIFRNIYRCKSTIFRSPYYSL